MCAYSCKSLHFSLVCCLTALVLASLLVPSQSEVSTSGDTTTNQTGRRWHPPSIYNSPHKGVNANLYRRGRSRSRDGHHRITPSDANLQWNAAKNTWESIHDRENSPEKERNMPVDVLHSQGKSTLVQRGVSSSGISEGVTRRFTAVPPYTARFVGGVNVQNLPVDSGKKRVRSNEESRQINLETESNRRKYLKNNRFNNRYVSRKLPRTINPVNAVTGKMVNPFDQLSRSVRTNSNNGNKTYSINSDYATSNHFSLRLNSTSPPTPESSLLQTMNKPITPYNWRRSRTNLVHPRRVGTPTTSARYNLQRTRNRIPYRKGTSVPAKITPLPLSSEQPTVVDKRPNILLILTDDLDVELGSLNYMPRLKSLLQAEGGDFPHSYTSTPMCCPSRSSLLTGMYIHNHEVYTNNDNCSSVRWQETHEQRTFATYLQKAGYKTGYFGKYLNKYKGPYTPPGWTDWMGLRLNSRYYNYTVYKNGLKIKHGDSYPKDYFPHVITKEGVRFLRAHSPSSPFMMVLSYPSPHGPEDSAPEHSERFMNITDHHTVAYDYAPNPDKQWILQYTSRMAPIQLKFTNMLMTKRVQTLQSVDEGIERIIKELKELNHLDNTYIFFTSDHGYHLGQFGLVKGKSMNFEFDVKIPFIVRGPGVVKNARYDEITLNVDLAPTFLDIGGVKPPPHMDGRSLFPVLKGGGEREATKWRNSFLIESSGRHRDEEVFEMKAQKRYKHLNRLLNLESRINSTIAENNSVFAYSPNTANYSAKNESLSPNDHVDSLPLYTSKHEHLEVVCKNLHLQRPCSPNKKWRCQHDGYRWRLKKCRSRSQPRECECSHSEGGKRFRVRLDEDERKRQKTFLKRHVNNNLRRLSPKFLKTFVEVQSNEVSLKRRRRLSRSVDEADDSEIDDGDVGDGDSGVSAQHGANVHAYVEEEELKDIERQIYDIYDELNHLESVNDKGNTPTNVTILEVAGGCTSVGGLLVDCPQEVYSDRSAWLSSKHALDEAIRRLSQQMKVLKSIRQHLRVSRPTVRRQKGGQKTVVGASTHDELPTNSTDIDGSTAAEGSNLPGGTTDPDHYSYTDGYYGNKYGRVESNSTLNSTNCWCNRRGDQLRMNREKKLERLIERRKQRQLRMQLKLNRRKLRRKSNKAESCNLSRQNCFQHDKDHWKTPPLWTDESFCSCLNSANNTYWCVRTINSTHNSLYCEFITGLITFYDLKLDPNQLRNVAFMLDNTAVAELHNMLTVLRSCRGVGECDAVEAGGGGLVGSEEVLKKVEEVKITEGKKTIEETNRSVGMNRKLKREQKRRRKLMRKLRKEKKRKKINSYLLGSSNDVTNSSRRSRMEKFKRREKRRRRLEEKLKQMGGD